MWWKVAAVLLALAGIGHMSGPGCVSDAMFDRWARESEAPLRRHVADYRAAAVQAVEAAMDAEGTRRCGRREDAR